MQAVKTFEYYNLCLPDDVTLFLVPVEAIRRWDSEVQVYDVLVESGLVLRHYAFYNHWFEVNCTLDTQGDFVAELGPIPWSFNIDVCTPFFSRVHRGFTVDLCLDVLVAPDGTQHILKDEDEFSDAIQRYWITDVEREGARTGLADILQIVTGGHLICFLSEICPFDVQAVLQPPFEKPKLATISEFKQGDRSQHFGTRRP
jgi:predicted RNA-binding protein associated with RNAse of E/G family